MKSDVLSYKERPGGGLPILTGSAKHIFEQSQALHLAAGGEYRLLLLKEGTASYGEKAFSAHKGLLLSPGQTVLCEFLQGAVLLEAGFQWAEAPRLLAPLLGKKEPVLFSATQGEPFSALLDNAKQPPAGCNPALYRCGVLLELFSLLPLQETEAPAQDLGKQAMDYIREHFTRPIGVNDVAEAIGVSRSWLYRCFMEYAAQSPAMYLRELRLLRAKSLLQRTSMPIQDIAYAVGYEDPLYFSRVFAAYEGCSPSAYRKSV